MDNLNKQVLKALEQKDVLVQQGDIAALEQEHIRGYVRQPQTVEEIAEWEPEQVWGEYEPEETE
jgi:2-phospho-L-lactate guanylyltransferase (CobY/MobA/RfbA family)